MAYNRDSTRSNSYIGNNPHNSRIKDRALNLAVASAILNKQLPADIHIDTSKPHYILVLERGKIKHQHLPQWYNLFFRGALAAAGILVMISGTPAGAQETKKEDADAAIDAVLQAPQSKEDDLVRRAEDEYLRGTIDKFTTEQRKAYLKNAHKLLNRAEEMTPGIQYDFKRRQINNVYAQILKGKGYYELGAEEQKQIDNELSAPVVTPKQPQPPSTPDSTLQVDYDELIKLAENALSASKNTSLHIGERAKAAERALGFYSQAQKIVGGQGLEDKFREVGGYVADCYVQAFVEENDVVARKKHLSLIRVYSAYLAPAHKALLREIEDARTELGDILGEEPQPPTPSTTPPVHPPVQPPAQPTPPMQPAAQPTPQAKQSAQTRPAPGQLILPNNPLFWSTIEAASYKSLQTREAEAVIRTGLVDICAQGHIRKDKEEVSGDLRRIQGAGGHAFLDTGFFEAGATGSYSKYRRNSDDNDTTGTGGVIITTNTEGVEEIEREYLALTAGMKFGNFRLRGTARNAVEKNSIKSTVNGFVDSPDPIGDYQFIIVDEKDFDITTRGAQVLFGYEWDFRKDDCVLDEVCARAVGDVEQVKIGINDAKYRTWRADFLVCALGKDAEWGASTSVGTRLIEDAEEQSRYSRIHGSFNAAADLNSLVGELLGIPIPATLFGSFWRLDQPAGGAGFVIGNGNAVKLMMDYSNQRAWHELGLSKELGPEERKVKMDLLNYDLLRGLTADPTLRLMLFGGCRRNEDVGNHEYDWTAQAALVLPVSEKVVFALDGLRDKVGIEEIIRAGLNVKLPGGWRFGFWGGRYRVDGAKHDDAPIYGLSGGVDF